MRAVPGTFVVGLMAVGVLFVVGCSSTDNPMPEKTATFPQRVGKALTACGLDAPQAGVGLGGRGELVLSSHQSGHPTSVTAVTASCVLDQLGLTGGNGELFDSDSRLGGVNTVSWDDLTASWSFRDTISFRVTVDQIISR